MSNSGILPRRLRCEYMNNPVGIGEEKPRLSWIAEATRQDLRGQRQSAWQVQVTTRAAGFEAPSHWDTGKVDTAQSIQIEYMGKPLEGDRKYLWRVRLWDGDGNVSPWSDAATWRMGPTGEDVLDATWIEGPAPMLFDRCKWVWHGDEENPAVSAKARTIAVQQVLDVPENTKVTFAKLLLAADDTFVVYVNGREVGRAAERLDSWREPTELDLSSDLKPGTNRIAVVATNHTDGSPAGLTGKLVVRYANQRQIVLPIDDSWMIHELDSPEDFDPTVAMDAGTKAKVIAPVGLTDPVVVPLTPWGIPGSREALTLPPARYFRTTFDLESLPAEAVLHASALGIAEVWINGHRVGEDFFAPGWTDYNKRVYTTTHEVLAHLRPGRNIIVAILADGWHSGYVAWSRRRDHYGAEPKFLAQLNLHHGDGKVEKITTNGDWKVSLDGPIREADLLMGERYDAQISIDSWWGVGFDDSSLAPVVISESPKAKVECYPAVPVRAIEEIPAKIVTEPRPGVHVFDMGQNFAGIVRIRTAGPKGAQVTIRHAEVLTDEGELYTEALRGARCTDVYIKGTDEPEIWQPRFTFHGFRYVEVTGLPVAPSLEDVIGIVLHNPMESTGELATSSIIANKLAENIRWGQRGNFLEVPTDCPQRDERLGWTGDAQIFIRTATFQYDVAPFFTKWLRDLFDTQNDEGWFCAVAPAIALWPNPEMCFAAWADAAIICPWTLYRVYKDTRIVERHWDAMVRYMNYLEETSDGLIRPDEGFGDWVSLNSHTPRDLLGTAYFANNARMMTELATALGRDDDAAHFAKLHGDIRDAFQKTFLEPDGGVRGRTQCSYVLALRHDLLPDHLRPVAAKFLAQDIAYRGGHFSTGFIGLKDLMPTLTDSGHHKLACRILLNEEFPSWGYQIRAGATTVWERWDGWSEELGLQTPGMNSFNHYAFGAVGEWMFSHLAGIDLAEPGFSRVRIAPHPDENLQYTRARHLTPVGWASSEWIRNSREGTLLLRCRIPVGATGEIHLPVKNPALANESGLPLADHPDLRITGKHGTSVVLEAPSGHYDFIMPL
ncbi:MAG: family 78 glycoside hydrolase catalytic domain [Candidatus Sumerlaeia bacterium]|nr:family 78 glycoside hydrolase catalytic domain [Candidatus Sumerlaeia bacterium]